DAPAARPSPSSSAIPSRDEIVWLVHRASMAPSGANDQPWRFSWPAGHALDGYLDRTRCGSFLDYQCSASYLALGAAAENGAIAASELGRQASVDLFPEPSKPDLVFRLDLARPAGALARDPLLPFVEARATNRRLGDRRSLSNEQVRALEAAARERGAELTLVSDPELLTEIGALLGSVDRFRFSCERLHLATLRELRFSPEEARATRDG